MSAAGEAAAAAATGDDGFNTVILVVGFVCLIVVGVFVGAYVNHVKMVKNAPVRPKKKLGAKQMKREKLKMGLRPAGDD